MCISRTHEPQKTISVHGFVHGFTVLGGAFVDLGASVYGFQRWAFVFFGGGGVYGLGGMFMVLGCHLCLWGKCF